MASSFLLFLFLNCFDCFSLSQGSIKNHLATLRIVVVCYSPTGLSVRLLLLRSYIIVMINRPRLFIALVRKLLFWSFHLNMQLKERQNLFNLGDFSNYIVTSFVMHVQSYRQLLLQENQMIFPI